MRTREFSLGDWSLAVMTSVRQLILLFIVATSALAQGVSVSPGHRVRGLVYDSIGRVDLTERHKDEKREPALKGPDHCPVSSR